EAALFNPSGLEKIEVRGREIKEAYEKLNTGDEPDIIILGCPHASLKEISKIAGMLEGKKLKKPLWVCTARATKDAATRLGLVQKIEAAGGKVVADTCAVVSPIERLGFKTVAVDSGKAGNYLPGFCKQQVIFKSVEELLEEYSC
ncbi:MAG: aconitase X, partial [Candidatus Hadarchaeales archaeon]